MGIHAAALGTGVGLNSGGKTSPGQYVALLLATGLSLVACGETNFATNKKAAGAGEPQDVTVPSSSLELNAKCAATTPLIAAATGPGPWPTTLSSELCPTESSSGLHVAILVDTSYSMRDVDPPFEGNCGRLTAGKALLTSLRATIVDQASARLSIIYFAEKAAVVKRDVLLGSADELMTTNLLCAIESEPTGFTSYKAAFDRLPDLEGNGDLTRLAYFISDGVPTTGGDAAPGFLEDVAESKRRLEIHAAAGADAWAKASAGKDGKPWTLNALFLGNKADYSKYDFDADAYLAGLTGSPTRVGLVSAADLANVMVAMPVGVPGIDPGTVKAVLRIGTSERPLEVLGVTRTHPGTNWQVTVKPFDLPGGTEPQGAPRIAITATDGVGRTVESLTDIRVEPAGDSR